jgi:hypothetical protein
VRVNVVSPPWVDETLAKYGMQVDQHLPAKVVARAYVAALEGTGRGQILDPAAFQ